MIYDLQKANIWKRISAHLFDAILVGMVAVGIAAILSAVLGYDGHSNKVEEFYNRYEEEYNVDFDISAENFNALAPEEQERYRQVHSDLFNNDEFFYSYYMVINLSFIIAVFGILIAFILMEFVIPMIFKNGQTIGKKVFGVAVMRTDGVRISGPILFTRSILGKCVVETILPVAFILMVVFQMTSLLSAIVAIAAIHLTNIIMMIVSKKNAGIHDTIANTVAVDFASQLIFESPEALLEYKQKIHEEKVKNAEYK